MDLPPSAPRIAQPCLAFAYFYFPDTFGSADRGGYKKFGNENVKHEGRGSNRSDGLVVGGLSHRRAKGTASKVEHGRWPDDPVTHIFRSSSHSLSLSLSDPHCPPQTKVKSRPRESEPVCPALTLYGSSSDETIFTIVTGVPIAAARCDVRTSVPRRVPARRCRLIVRPRLIFARSIYCSLVNEKLQIFQRLAPRAGFCEENSTTKE